MCGTAAPAAPAGGCDEAAALAFLEEDWGEGDEECSTQGRDEKGNGGRGKERRGVVWCGVVWCSVA